MNEAALQVRRALQAIYSGKTNPKMEAARGLTAMVEVERQLADANRLYQRATALHQKLQEHAIHPAMRRAMHA